MVEELLHEMVGRCGISGLFAYFASWIIEPKANVVCTMVRMLFFNDHSILLLVPVVTQQPRGCECRHLPNVKPVIVSDAVHILLNAVLCFRRYWPTCYRFQHT